MHRNRSTKRASIIVTIIAIGLVLFCSTGGASDSEKSANFEQGLIYFKASNYEDAYKLFLIAFKSDPGNSTTNFYLGRAAFEIGNYEMALMAFERILIAEPDSIRVKLEMARTYYRLGLRENARQYFEEVLASNPPAAVRRNIEIFLDDLELAEKSHFFSGQIATALDWDDNVYVAPANDIVDTVIGEIQLTGKSGKPTEDFIFNTTASVNHTYRPLDSTYSWSTTGDVYQALYQTESDLDTLFLALNTGPEAHLKRYMLGLHGLANYLAFDRKRFLQTVGIEAVLGIMLGPHTLLNLSTKHENKTYYQIDNRDSLNSNLIVESVFLFGANRIGLAATAEYESAQDDIYTYKQGGARIHYERLLPHDMMFLGYYEYRYREFENQELLFDKTRKDNLHYAGVGLSKTIWHSPNFRQNLSLRCYYRYVRSDSNIELYEYDKNVVSASLAYTF
jgi:hypothetical protein